MRRGTTSVTAHYSGKKRKKYEAGTTLATTKDGDTANLNIVVGEE